MGERERGEKKRENVVYKGYITVERTHRREIKGDGGNSTLRNTVEIG